MFLDKYTSTEKKIFFVVSGLILIRLADYIQACFGAGLYTDKLDSTFDILLPVKQVFLGASSTGEHSYSLSPLSGRLSEFTELLSLVLYSRLLIKFLGQKLKRQDFWFPLIELAVWFFIGIRALAIVLIYSGEEGFGGIYYYSSFTRLLALVLTIFLVKLLARNYGVVKDVPNSDSVLKLETYRNTTSFRYAHNLLDNILLSLYVPGSFFLLNILDRYGNEPIRDSAYLWAFLLPASILITRVFLEKNLSQTFGKFLLKGVVKGKGENPTWREVLLRTFSRLIPFNEISFLFGGNWHDRISKTSVVFPDHNASLLGLLKVIRVFGIVSIAAGGWFLVSHSVSEFFDFSISSRFTENFDFIMYMAISALLFQSLLKSVWFDQMIRKFRTDEYFNDSSDTFKFIHLVFLSTPIVGVALLDSWNTHMQRGLMNSGRPEEEGN